MPVHAFSLENDLHGPLIEILLQYGNQIFDNKVFSESQKFNICLHLLSQVSSQKKRKVLGKHGTSGEKVSKFVERTLIFCGLSYSYSHHLKTC